MYVELINLVHDTPVLFVSLCLICVHVVAICLKMNMCGVVVWLLCGNVMCCDVL